MLTVSIHVVKNVAQCNDRRSMQRYNSIPIDIISWSMTCSRFLNRMFDHRLLDSPWPEAPKTHQAKVGHSSYEVKVLNHCSRFLIWWKWVERYARFHRPFMSGCTSWNHLSVTQWTHNPKLRSLQLNRSLCARPIMTDLTLWHIVTSISVISITCWNRWKRCSFQLNRSLLVCARPIMTDPT